MRPRANSLVMLLCAATLATWGCRTPAGGSAATASAGPEEERVPPEEGTATSTDGVPIHFRAEGRGAPPLVLLHGWSCDAGYWKEQIESFARRHRVVAIDLAGHGASGAGRARYTIPSFAADVRAVVERLDLGGIVLVGHSMGGYVAVEAARQMPDRVRAIVPVDSILDAEWQPDPDELDVFLAALQRDFVAEAATFVRKMFRDDADPDLIEQIATDMASAPPDVAVSALRGTFAYDLTAALSQVHAPIRAINSDRLPTALDVNRRYAPRFEAVILHGAGHFLMLERPREFNRLLRQAIEDLTEGPP